MSIHFKINNIEVEAEAGELLLNVAKRYDTDTAQALDFKALDELIAQAKEDMERAAKELDFDAAIRHRNRMYDLQKIRDTEIGALKK